VLQNTRNAIASRSRADLGQRLLARQAVRAWVRSQNQTVKQTDEGVRLLPCLLPSKSPWLNPIEATWVHGTRNVSDADRILSADELEARVCAYYGVPREPHLVMPKKVA
jgi:hypothetical protein